MLECIKMSKLIPLYDSYSGKGIKRIEQDVYDRFFTSIEQRFERKDIMELNDTFDNVTVSDNVPYWHFLCRSEEPRRGGGDTAVRPGAPPALAGRA